MAKGSAVAYAGRSIESQRSPLRWHKSKIRLRDGGAEEIPDRRIPAQHFLSSGPPGGLCALTSTAVTAAGESLEVSAVFLWLSAWLFVLGQQQA